MSEKNAVYYYWLSWDGHWVFVYNFPALYTNDRFWENTTFWAYESILFLEPIY